VIGSLNTFLDVMKHEGEWLVFTKRLFQALCAKKYLLTYRSTNTPDEVHDNPGSIEQGLTGIDLSLPIFDGLSTDPDQHLIDLDTESMERHADVRMYFWIIGHSLQEAETE
jgi:hypothetical protein